LAGRRRRGRRGRSARLESCCADSGSRAVLLRPPHHLPSSQASKEDATAAAAQVKGAIMPISKEAPALEKVAITADMKVGRGLGRGAGG
jgi:hypothetical protein